MSLQREIPIAGLDKEWQRNQDIRLKQSSVLASLEIETPNGFTRDTKSQYNAKNLSAGMHAPIRVERPFSFVGGIGVKTISSGRSIIDQRAVIDGVHFKNSASSSVELVTVGTKATNPDVRVVFRNCVFERTKRSNAAVWVQVGADAKAVFVGCMFSGGNSAGTYIVNVSGVAANVQLVGCVLGDPTIAVGTVTSTGVIS